MAGLAVQYIELGWKLHLAGCVWILLMQLYHLTLYWNEIRSNLLGNIPYLHEQWSDQKQSTFSLHIKEQMQAYEYLVKVGNLGMKYDTV